MGGIPHPQKNLKFHHRIEKYSLMLRLLFLLNRWKEWECILQNCCCLWKIVPKERKLWLRELFTFSLTRVSFIQSRWFSSWICACSVVENCSKQKKKTTLVFLSTISGSIAGVGEASARSVREEGARRQVPHSRPHRPLQGKAPQRRMSRLPPSFVRPIVIGPFQSGFCVCRVKSCPRYQNWSNWTLLLWKKCSTDFWVFQVSFFFGRVVKVKRPTEQGVVFVSLWLCFTRPLYSLYRHPHSTGREPRCLCTHSKIFHVCVVVIGVQDPPPPSPFTGQRMLVVVYQALSWARF